MVRPGQIPVRRAAGLYVAERAGTLSGPASAASALAQSDDPGAKLLSASLSDPPRAMRALTALGRPITGPDDLMRTVTGDPVSMGFRPGVSTLTAAEWEMVYEYLSQNRLKGRAD
jgi:hypothetical protein